MRDTVLWTHETVLAADAVSAARARAFVQDQLLAHDLPDVVEDSRLVVSELATNAVLHAQTPFTVTLERTQQSVVLTVRDGSSSVPVPVAAVSRDWGVSVGEDGAKAVWASFAARTREPTPG
jgi:anti-sigma regulatory factor (Ser/Thr protein kinase)